MPRLQEVGTALHPSSADETRAQVPENDVFAADGEQNAAAAATNHLVVQGGGYWSGINGREQSPFRSPSPEYVDAVEDLQYELQHKAMGETVTRGDTNEASILNCLVGKDYRVNCCMCVCREAAIIVATKHSASHMRTHSNT